MQNRISKENITTRVNPIKSERTLYCPIKRSKNEYLISPVVRVSSNNNELKCPVKKFYGQEIQINTFDHIESLTDSKKTVQSRSLSTGLPYNQKVVKKPIYPFNLKPLNYEKELFMTYNLSTNILKNKEILLSNENKYISDELLTVAPQWFCAHNPIIFISSGTGTGKTTFVQKLAVEFNKRVLIITNRTATKKQLNCKVEVEEIENNVYITSYQSIERSIHFNIDFLDSFDVLVADEAHYFISDSLANNRVNVSYQKILSTRKVVKIFMSATLEEIAAKIVSDYHLINIKTNPFYVSSIFNYVKNNNASIIKKVYKISSIQDLYNDIIASNEKWLIFVSKKADGYEIQKELIDNGLTSDDVIFINREDVNSEKNKAKFEFDNLSLNEKFNCKVLISTKIIDNGVNVIDRSLKHVVIDTNDKPTFLQMLGRKRCLDYMDTFNLYIPCKNQTSIAKLINQKHCQVKKMDNIKNELQSQYYIKPLLLDSDKEADEYRKYLFLPEFQRAYQPFDFNIFGYLSLINELKYLNYLLETGFFEGKLIWVKSITKSDFQVTDLREETFLNIINPYIGNFYEKSNKEVKISVNKAFKSIYGLQGKSDYRDSISLTRLDEKFKTENLPLQIIQTKRRFLIG